jgi:hypothetical protein
MESIRILRLSGFAGVVAAVMILGGLYLSSRGVPGPDADAASWAAWAEREEVAVESGVYLLLVPGLLLFLCMFATLAGLLPTHGAATRLASYSAIGFFVCLAVAAVLSSTASSSDGFFAGFEDPGALSVYTGVAAGFHLQMVGVWSLALTMVAVAVGLRRAGAATQRLVVASCVLAVVTAAAGAVGVGIVPALLWIVAAGVGLFRRSGSPAGQPGGVPQSVPN